MDPWYGLGGADMLDVAHMAVHAVPMTSREAIRWTFDAVTEIPARMMGLEDYGLEVGAFADMVVLQAADPIEAVRLRATRLAVIRRGKVIARTSPCISQLDLEGRPASFDRASYAPRSSSRTAFGLKRPGFPCPLRDRRSPLSVARPCAANTRFRGNETAGDYANLQQVSAHGPLCRRRWPTSRGDVLADDFKSLFRASRQSSADRTGHQFVRRSRRAR